MWKYYANCDGPILPNIDWAKMTSDPVAYTHDLTNKTVKR